MFPVNELHPDSPPELISFLKDFITKERFLKFQKAIGFRTRFLTVVLEDIYQPHNASAVLRTCDCFGIQDVHIIENRNKYQVNPDVALGSAKWLSLKKYNETQHNTEACLTKLKLDGYRLVSTTPHKDHFTPETLPLRQKTALIFGTELMGLTPIAIEMADDFVKIPMVGFTESLNISVSAAILIQTLTQRIRTSDVAWQLPEREQNLVLLEWLKRSINKSEAIISLFAEKKQLR